MLINFKQLINCLLNIQFYLFSRTKGYSQVFWHLDFLQDEYKALLFAQDDKITLQAEKEPHPMVPLLRVHGVIKSG